MSQKKRTIVLSPATLQMLTDFQNPFNGRLTSKYSTKLLLTKYSAIHLKHIATIARVIITDIQKLDFLFSTTDAIIVKGDFVQHLLYRATHRQTLHAVAID